MKKQYTIPGEYLELSPIEIERKIAEIKDKLQDSLIILAHHYQRDEVYKFADFTGDSLKLSQFAATNPKSKFIVFCGVHFMAETADILTEGKKIVTLPDLRAGCPMADMAPISKVKKIWKHLQENALSNSIIPITYINSSATLKAFCAENGGTVCTSSNASKIIKWALNQNKKILFLPDRHLGKNISMEQGIPEEEINEIDINTEKETISKTQILLWRGHCPVHNKFTINDFLNEKNLNPNLKLIVHPECPPEVYKIADFKGSTQKIIEIIEAANPGTEWVIGTETHLVGRLAKNNPDKKIKMLTTAGCMCSMMDRISPAHLLWNLETILNNDPVNQISVPKQTAFKAKKALDLMLSLS